MSNETTTHINDNDDPIIKRNRKKFPELYFLTLTSEKYNGEHTPDATPKLIQNMDFVSIKLAPAEAFNPKEDILIYLYSTKGTIAKIAQFSDENRQRTMGKLF